MNRMEYEEYRTIYNELIKLNEEGKSTEENKCLLELSYIRNLELLEDYIKINKLYDAIAGVKSDLLTIIRGYKSL